MILDTVTVVGVVASFCSAISLLPQLVKMLREKEAGSVSLTMLIILLCGLMLWIIYGILKEDIIIIISNSISLSINVTVTVLYLYYKKTTETSADDTIK